MSTPTAGWHEHHHHLFLGGALETVETLFGTRLVDFRTFEPPTPMRLQTASEALGRLNRWIIRYFRPLVMRKDFVALATQASLLQAQADNVTVLESSLGVNFPTFLHRSPTEILEEIAHTHARTAPEIKLKLDLGFSRSIDATLQERWLDDFLATMVTHPELSTLVSGVDLFDVEDAQPPENFLSIYRKATDSGLKLKAHVGEFCDAQMIRHTVETLNLAEVQHGIQAYNSPETLAFLAERGTILNLSPASNVCLGAVDFQQESHPIRRISDAGVRFTISTDDYLLFHATISEQMATLRF